MPSDRDWATEREELVRDLRNLVLNYNGPIEESPHYAQLARLLVSECITDQKRFPSNRKKG